MKTPEATHQAGIVVQTYYQLFKEYGGMRFDQPKQLKRLDKEILLLKKIVTEKEMDMQIHCETLALEIKTSKSGEKMLGSRSLLQCFRI